MAAPVGYGSGPLHPKVDVDPDVIPSTEPLAVPIKEGASALGPQGWCQQVAMWPEVLSLSPG